MNDTPKSTSEPLISCLENEGLKFLFGTPSEKNIRFIDVKNGALLRFILALSEQAVLFMTVMYGLVTGNVGVCYGTLGREVTNMLVGIADT
ncbi:thiamine pyrophosphate-binding protein [Microbulbifer sp. DLAB2-AA]|uniref:thiamine pyrophosphate-binding protein n=1 Tax=Microbulbifer sp. DLAB2-AA TaxID=3243394 RepID=UPI0040398B9C